MTITPEESARRSRMADSLARLRDAAPAPVGVLAVLEGAGNFLIAKGAPPADVVALHEARAAIAELIEKAETAEQALRNLVAAGAHPNWANYADDLRAALARVGGAP